MLIRGNRQSSLILMGFTLILSILAAWGIWFGHGELESIAAFEMESPEEGETQNLLREEGIQVRGTGAEVIGDRIQITREGTYRIAGTLSEGQIYVAAGTKEAVTLLLAGVEITNGEKPALHVESAGEVEIVLEEGTENRLQSGEAVPIGESEEEAEGSRGALYARCDLSIEGTGSLKVLGYINNGIHTVKNLLIKSGTIEVEAVNHGIKGKESITVQDGNLLITAGKDGMKSDGETGEGYGVISLSGGDIRIDSQEDAVQAETVLEVAGGTYQITAGGGSKNAAQEERTPEFGGGGRMPEMEEGQIPGGTPDFGGKPRKFDREAPDFQENLPEGGRGPQGFGGDRPNDRPDMEADTEEEEAEPSAKGFKCKTQMVISGGTFSVDARDDAFHSDGTIEITGGTFGIASGDDGVHADTELTVAQGTIRIQTCREGLEANQIWIQGGTLDITSSDDGLNAYGGSSGFGMGPEKEKTGKTTEEMPNLWITGGSLTVNADGDGLDSNGNIRIDGGEILVNGPSDNGNGAIDSGMENGGACEISGGTILALGSSGMAETFGDTSVQYSFRYNFPQSFQAGDLLRIENGEGDILYSCTAVKSGNSVVFSCPELTEGESYTLYAGEQSVQIPL